MPEFGAAGCAKLWIRKWLGSKQFARRHSRSTGNSCGKVLERKSKQPGQEKIEETGEAMIVRLLLHTLRVHGEHEVPQLVGNRSGNCCGKGFTVSHFGIKPRCICLWWLSLIAGAGDAFHV